MNRALYKFEFRRCLRCGYSRQESRAITLAYLADELPF